MACSPLGCTTLLGSLGFQALGSMALSCNPGQAAPVPTILWAYFTVTWISLTRGICRLLPGGGGPVGILWPISWANRTAASIRLGNWVGMAAARRRLCAAVRPMRSKFVHCLYQFHECTEWGTTHFFGAGIKPFHVLMSFLWWNDVVYDG